MNIFIIGSEGFIGSSLVTRLRSFGHNIYLSDIISRNESDVFFLLDADNFDLTIPFNSIQFDFCINCTGAADVSDSLNRPLRDFNLNVYNMVKVLEAIRLYQPECKFINLSSASVYGNPLYLPINEEHPIHPISPYGWHKYQSELLCKEYYYVYGIGTCSLRIFSAFGNGLKKQLFWDIGQKLKANNMITLFGTGNESRDFIHIDDLTSAISNILSSDYFEGDSINVANGSEITVKEIADIFESNLSNVKITFSGEIRKGYPINWRSDISKLSKIGYIQKVSFESGVNNYIEWLKENA